MLTAHLMIALVSLVAAGRCFRLFRKAPTHALQSYAMAACGLCLVLFGKNLWDALLDEGDW